MRDEMWRKAGDGKEDYTEKRITDEEKESN